MCRNFRSVLVVLCVLIQLSRIRMESASDSKGFYSNRLIESGPSINDVNRVRNFDRNFFSRSPILSLTDATALRPLVMHSDKRTPNQFKNFMLNKDKADEAEADLGAIKNERSLYIPRAVIKRPKNIHLMPFGDGRMATVAARNGEVAHSLFYVVLNQPPVSVDSNEMRFTRLNEKIPITLQSATS